LARLRSASDAWLEGVAMSFLAKHNASPTAARIAVVAAKVDQLGIHAHALKPVLTALQDNASNHRAWTDLLLRLHALMRAGNIGADGVGLQGEVLATELIKTLQGIKAMSAALDAVSEAALRCATRPGQPHSGSRPIDDLQQALDQLPKRLSGVDSLSTSPMAELGTLLDPSEEEISAAWRGLHHVLAALLGNDAIPPSQWSETAALHATNSDGTGSALTYVRVPNPELVRACHEAAATLGPTHCSALAASDCLARVLLYLAPLAVKPVSQQVASDWMAGEQERASHLHARRSAPLGGTYFHENALSIEAARFIASLLESDSGSLGRHLQWLLISKTFALVPEQATEGVASGHPHRAVAIPSRWDGGSSGLLRREPQCKKDMAPYFDAFRLAMPPLGQALSGQYNAALMAIADTRPGIGNGTPLLEHQALLGVRGEAIRNFVLQSLQADDVSESVRRIVVATVLVPMSPQWGGRDHGVWFVDAPHPRTIYFTLFHLAEHDPWYQSIYANFVPRSSADVRARLA
jgi:hypothetical protein